MFQDVLVQALIIELDVSEELDYLRLNHGSLKCTFDANFRFLKGIFILDRFCSTRSFFNNIELSRRIRQLLADVLEVAEDKLIQLYKNS